jgi:hypothetical protein
VPNGKDDILLDVVEIDTFSQLALVQSDIRNSWYI